MNASIAERPRGQTIHVLQGEYKIASEPGINMTTILGSCIAVCLFDSKKHCGGMNHFLLPDGQADNSGRYGVYSMELLVNGLLKVGAQREHLVAKVFGGARMVPGFQDIGARNAAFALDFLKTEKIPCVGQSTGGNNARRIRFDPYTGVARQLLLQQAAQEVNKKVPTVKEILKEDAGDLELL